jgi:hypothetical protein
MGPCRCLMLGPLPWQQVSWQQNRQHHIVTRVVGGAVVWLAGHAHLSCLDLRQRISIGVGVHSFSTRVLSWFIVQQRRVQASHMTAHEAAYTPNRQLALSPDHRSVICLEASHAHELRVCPAKGVGRQVPAVRNSSILQKHHTPVAKPSFQ